VKVLGIHIGHDSSAALVVGGKVVADVAEERFTRIKHYAGLPVKAVEYCLASQEMTIGDIDMVAVPTRGRIPGLNYLLSLDGDRAEKPSLGRKLLELALDLRGVPRSKQGPPVYFKSFPIPKRTEILHVDHHLAHAASAYFTGGNREKQLIVTMDGSGDGFATCLWRGENGRIDPLEKYPNGGSLGFFYGNVTEALGWVHGDGEGKTMGLAPYGDASKVSGLLRRFHPRFSAGALVEPHDFGQHYVWNETGALQWHLEEAAAIQTLIEKHGRENVAAEAQAVLEAQAAEVIYPWLAKEKTRRLSCSGGIFLNVKLNQRIWESGRVDEQHIYPNAGDSGLAVGAALYAFFHNNPDAKVQAISDLYTGPAYTDEEIEKMLKARNLRYRKVEDPAGFAAQELAADKIVAWLQGRMESGPRALGNRSILVSANRAENKDILNGRVKFREAFRPFCPSLLWEKRGDYLEKARNEHFMITSFDCKPERRSKVPAVVHADGTMRPQTVTRESNPLFWDLIRKFGELTGEHLILNTSFNIMGEPIINHPREAIRCFYDTGLDHLVIGNWVLSKDNQRSRT
jgi:carbamoyltransferase